MSGSRLNRIWNLRRLAAGEYAGKLTWRLQYKATFDIKAKEFIEDYLLGHLVKKDVNAALIKLAQWMGFSQGTQESSVNIAGTDPLKTPVLGATGAPEYLSKIKKMLKHCWECNGGNT